MTRRFRIAGFALALLARASSGQPTPELTSCLHPLDQELGGLSLALVATDWDDDGQDNLALGAPFYDANSLVNNGRFASYEFDLSEFDEWSHLGGNTGPEGGRFGAALAAGDFDGDDVPELAIGQPSEGGGSVLVFETDGETCCDQLGFTLRQGDSDVEGVAEENDDFGSSLAAGDFDDDGYDDLAVGVPRESWSGIEGLHQGAVHVFYGSPTGLDGARDVLFGQNAFSGQTREADDRFGFALATGDLDGDGRDDLAIGAPYEDEGAVVDSGIVHVVFGGLNGLDFTQQQDWTQSSSGISSSPEAGDNFGWSLAIGDFDRTAAIVRRNDLAISAPCESDGAITCAGVVPVLYSDTDGPSATGADFFVRPGGSVQDASFGVKLLAAQLDSDPAFDLVASAATAIYTAPSGLEGSGEVFLFFGHDNQVRPLDLDLRPSGLAPWQATAGQCISLGETAEGFGQALAAGDFDDDGRMDLAIGINGWTDDLADPFKGAAQVLFGSDAIFRDGFGTGDDGRWSSSN